MRGDHFIAGKSVLAQAHPVAPLQVSASVNDHGVAFGDRLLDQVGKLSGCGTRICSANLDAYRVVVQVHGFAIGGIARQAFMHCGECASPVGAIFLRQPRTPVAVAEGVAVTVIALPLVCAVCGNAFWQRVVREARNALRERVVRNVLEFAETDCTPLQGQFVEQCAFSSGHQPTAAERNVHRTKCARPIGDHFIVRYLKLAADGDK